MKNPAYLFLSAKLADIIRENSTDLPIIVDEPGDLRIETKTGRPFASVRIQLRHVGVYLLPLYYHPEILPPVLSSRKSGKATFRFTEEDDVSIDELPLLMQRCHSLVGNY